jgi:23S rRNA (guanosine2251-2'-O)-methyltransferase
VRELYVIAHDIRSAHNVGSLFRTAEGLGVKKLFLTGTTPYPRANDDKRLPHLTKKLSARINKTALGASEHLDWEHKNDIFELIDELKQTGISIVALEQTADAAALDEYEPPSRLALVLGSEIDGVEAAVIDLSDSVIQIPMQGKKESFNVVQAAAMALYRLRFH